MELISKPIVCQREEVIPKEVKQLRRYIRRSVVAQKFWLSLLTLSACAVIIIYFSPVLVIMYGKILETALGVAAVVIFLFLLYCFLARVFGPKWVEEYYKRSLVLIEIEPSDKNLGHHTYAEVHDLLQKLSNKMGFLIVPGIFLYDKYKAETNAFYTNIVDHHTKTEKIVLHKNLFSILNKDEIRAIMAHELGHLIQPWPFLFRSERYSRACELLADYNALVYAGLLPTVNALIHIYAQRNYFSALWERAQEMLLSSGFQIESIDELFEKTHANIREEEMGNSEEGENEADQEEGENEADQLVKRLQERMSPKKLTFRQQILRRLSLRKVHKLRQWRNRWKAHLPKQFEQFYSDRTIDENEFKILVEQIAKDNKSDLFVPPPPKEQKKLSHPMLRERLLFLARCANFSDNLPPK